MTHSDGSTASYYDLPEGATELQHLISHLDLNAQMGEILRACYRYGQCSHSPKTRDIKKILFYAQAELTRLESIEDEMKPPTAKTVREIRLEAWLREVLPIVINTEMSTKTSPRLRELIELIKKDLEGETNG